MRIIVENIGPLSNAEFSLGELTIMCGKNNTGKTLVNYALYGILKFWREFDLDVDNNIISESINNNSVRIDLNIFERQTETIINDACKQYSKEIYRLYAAAEASFAASKFRIKTERQKPLENYQKKHQFENNQLILIKDFDANQLAVTMLNKFQDHLLPSNLLHYISGDAVKEILFGNSFPKPFVASAERIGAAIFRNELIYYRNQILDDLGLEKEKNINPFDLALNRPWSYPLPVKDNLEYIRDLDLLKSNRSFIAANHVEILKELYDILGGKYILDNDDEVFFVPNNKKFQSPIKERSGAVRLLINLGFYLRYTVQKGDLLMVDEPELNLHPHNQRRIARLVARLVNAGVLVFITTHSDYIIKELNTLIKLNQKDDRTKKIAKKYGFHQSELLDCHQIKMFTATKPFFNRQVTNDFKEEGLTLEPFDVTAKSGIQADTFDDTINLMNEIDDEYYWGH